MTACVSIRPALPAVPVPVRLNVGVLWRELVAVFAMGKRGPSGSRSHLSLGDTGPRPLIMFNDIFEGQPGRYPSNYRVTRPPSHFGKLDDLVLRAVNLRHDSDPPIALLFLAALPAAIVRLIALVVVSAVERVTMGTRPHVGDKVAEGRLPSLANCNAPPAVVCVLPSLWIGASLPHRHPSGIQFVRLRKWHAAIESWLVPCGNLLPKLPLRLEANFALRR